jgi:hypothetical protein
MPTNEPTTDELIARLLTEYKGSAAAVAILERQQSEIADLDARLKAVEEAAAKPPVELDEEELSPEEFDRAYAKFKAKQYPECFEPSRGNQVVSEANGEENHAKDDAQGRAATALTDADYEHIGREWTKENGKEPELQDDQYTCLKGAFRWGDGGDLHDERPCMLPSKIFHHLPVDNCVIHLNYNRNYRPEPIAYQSLGRALVASGTVTQEKPPIKHYMGIVGSAICKSNVPNQWLTDNIANTTCPKCNELIDGWNQPEPVPQEKPKQEPVDADATENLLQGAIQRITANCWDTYLKQRPRDWQEIFDVALGDARVVAASHTSLEAEIDAQRENLNNMGTRIANLQEDNAKLLAVIKQAGELAGRWERSKYGMVEGCAAELRAVLEEK